MSVMHFGAVDLAHVALVCDVEPALLATISKANTKAFHERYPGRDFAVGVRAVTAREITEAMQAAGTLSPEAIETAISVASRLHYNCVNDRDVGPRAKDALLTVVGRLVFVLRDLAEQGPALFAQTIHERRCERERHS